MRKALLLSVLTFIVIACGSEKRDAFDPNGTNGASGGPNGNGDGQFDPSKPDDQKQPKPNAVGWLQGKVVAPEGTVPIRGALLYLTKTMPDAIPDGVHCDTCVHLTALEPYAYSKADGTFDLPAYTTGKQWLVVQKGQFRRIREVDVTTGDQKVQADFTRLPSKTDPAAHDTIPKIGMVVGGFDKIDYTMKKLGIEQFNRYGDAPFEPGTPPGQKSGKNGYGLMNDVNELAKHHIVLMPCASLGYTQNDQVNGGGFTCGTPIGATKTALAQYVDAGGKLYVTDFSYETVRQTWPNYITWYDDTMQPMTSLSQKQGKACRGGAEDTPGKAEDQGLDEWLSTIGHPSVELHAAWSRIASVSPQPGFDPAGKPVTITPKVWMTTDIGGQKLPATVSFEAKCGRVLFSSYHCEGDDGSTLLPQEKALLYILLEVGVCVGELPPPPPPR